MQVRPQLEQQRQHLVLAEARGIVERGVAVDVGRVGVGAAGVQAPHQRVEAHAGGEEEWRRAATILAPAIDVAAACEQLVYNVEVVVGDRAMQKRLAVAADVDVGAGVEQSAQQPELALLGRTIGGGHAVRPFGRVNVGAGAAQQLQDGELPPLDLRLAALLARPLTTWRVRVRVCRAREHVHRCGALLVEGAWAGAELEQRFCGLNADIEARQVQRRCAVAHLLLQRRAVRHQRTDRAGEVHLGREGEARRVGIILVDDLHVCAVPREGADRVGAVKLRGHHQRRSARSRHGVHRHLLGVD